MKYTLTILVLLMSTVLAAQPKLTLSGPQVQMGNPASVTMSMVGGGMNPMAFQVSFNVPPGAVITIDPAMTLVGKQMASNVTAGVAKVIVWGGQTLNIPDGPVFQIGFPATAVQFAPTEAIAANAAGSAVTINATPFSFQVTTTACDLNGDFITDLKDEFLAAAQVVGAIACTNADLNGDGKCTIIDLQRIVIAANGGACKVGQ